MISREKTCKYCGAPIVMIKILPNQTLPCNAEAINYWQTATGTITIITPDGETIKADLQCNSRGVALTGYIPHRSVCPHFTKEVHDGRN